jgi:hypothetical protein
MNDTVLRDQLLELLQDGHAHMGLDEAVSGFPHQAMNERAPNVSYTPWELLEHIRIAQWDILAFIQDPDHDSPEWPAGYWPPEDTTATEEAWANTLRQIRSDREALVALVRDPETDLTAPLPHAPDYSLVREILTVADHSAYHLGEFAMMREVMDTWPEP